jgi:hypothetical protein
MTFGCPGCMPEGPGRLLWRRLTGLDHAHQMIDRFKQRRVRLQEGVDRPSLAETHSIAKVSPQSRDLWPPTRPAITGTAFSPKQPCDPDADTSVADATRSKRPRLSIPLPDRGTRKHILAFTVVHGSTLTDQHCSTLIPDNVIHYTHSIVAHRHLSLTHIGTNITLH